MYEYCKTLIPLDPPMQTYSFQHLLTDNVIRVDMGKVNTTLNSKPDTIRKCRDRLRRTAISLNANADPPSPAYLAVWNYKQSTEFKLGRGTELIESTPSDIQRLVSTLKS